MKDKKIFVSPLALAAAIAFASSAQTVGTGEIVNGSGSIHKGNNDTVIH